MNQRHLILFAAALLCGIIVINPVFAGNGTLLACTGKLEGYGSPVSSTSAPVSASVVVGG